jgi:exopolyphosphatase / guanosine-5'-triphosphate,3'-diphosphate pyrophosphatase
MKLAAIDIGSNAARLLINDVVVYNGQASFDKVNLIRIPLRLGFDVFETGRISALKADMFITTMKAFAYLIKAYEVTAVKACATSAMRDAANGQALIQQVKKEAGIDIELISGDQEAAYIFKSSFTSSLDKSLNYLYIDVGGGSTEITYFENGKPVYQRSVNIGTIRILKGMVTEDDWEALKVNIKKNIKSNVPVIAVGSGGNINKVFSLSKKKEGKSLTLELLKDYYKELSSFSVEERIHLYNLKEDRADVIVPALQIYINIMKWADIEQIYVPKIGLADGLIASLYEKFQATN